MPRHSFPDGPVTPSTSPAAMVTVRSAADAGDPNKLSDAKLTTAAVKRARGLDRTVSRPGRAMPVPALHHDCFTGSLLGSLASRRAQATLHPDVVSRVGRIRKRPAGSASS